MMTLAAAGFSAGATSVTYTKGGAGEPAVFGTTRAETYDVAITLGDASFAGSKVVGLRAPLASTENVASPKAFITTRLATEKLETGGRVNVADIEMVDARIEDGCIVAEFKSDYTLDGSPVYVGYSFEVTEITSSNRQPVSGSKETTPGGFNFRSSRTYSVWKDISEAQNFTSDMVVMLEGDFRKNGASLRIGYAPKTEPNKAFSVPVVITNKGSEPFRSFEYSWILDGEKGTGTYELDAPMDVEFGKSYGFRFDVDCDKADVGMHKLTLSLDKINGEENTVEPRESTIDMQVLMRVPVYRPLVEEYTGMWCGFCTRGFAGMEHMRKVYGNEFCLAVYHSSNVQVDHMEVPGLAFPNSPGGYPAAYINREEKIDPYHGRIVNGSLPKTFNFESDWLETRRQPTDIYIKVGADWLDEGKSTVNIDSEVVFIENPGDVDYGIGYILVADDITNRDDDPMFDPWVQNNNYWGAAIEIPEMEMFSKGDSEMFNLTYNDVALINTGRAPLENSLPARLEKNTAYAHSYSMNVASIKGVDGVELVQNRDAMRVIACVIDRATGNVLNSAQCRIGSGMDSDDEYVAGVPVADVVSELVSSEYYDLRGVRVAAPVKGLYIRVDHYSDGSAKSSKILK